MATTNPFCRMISGLSLTNCQGNGDDHDIDDDGHNGDDGAEVEFVHAVTAGGSVKFLPAV